MEDHKVKEQRNLTYFYTNKYSEVLWFFFFVVGIFILLAGRECRTDSDAYDFQDEVHIK